MEEKISIIIPVYNTEKYLEKCLDSIIDQTYSNLEILIIDDGSNDGSSKIYNKFKMKDKRIKVIYKKNGGLSEARNVGIDHATGLYICFVDSDDYIENNYIQKMYYQLINHDADICCCGKVVEYPNKKIYKNTNRDLVVDSVEALKLYFQKIEIDNSAVDKLFKMELFKKIRFPVGRYFEDIGTIYKVFSISKTIVHIKDPLYHYVMRNGSICHEQYSEKQLDSLYMTKEAVKYINGIYPQLVEYTAAYYALELVTTIRQIYHCVGKKALNTDYKNIVEEYTDKYSDLIHNKYIPLFKKIMMFLLRCHFYAIVDVLVYKSKRI